MNGARPMPRNLDSPPFGAKSRAWNDPDRYLALLEDPWYHLLVELQHCVSVETYRYWTSLDFRTLHLPITTHAISSPMGLGSDSLPVEVELGGVRTFLADSMQFMLEYGCRFHAPGCFYVMPSFRGEAADATHLSQFYHSEVELCGGLDDAIASAEAYIRHLTSCVLETVGGRLQRDANGTLHLQSLTMAAPLPRLTFDEAERMLGGDERYVRRPGEWRTLTRQGEQELLRRVGSPVWVTHWDHLAVPFYQAFADSERQRARNADLLLGIGEVVGLGERHATGEDVLSSLAQHDVPNAMYGWYVDLKRRFPMQTAGFGMGVERYLLWVLGHDDIRDIQLLPRMNGLAIIP